MSLTMEDFMVHFNNILCHNFGELRGILANQSVKLQKIENMLKELEKPIQPDEESDEDPVVEGNIDPTVNIKKEANLTENLKDLEPLPITSTPKPKRNSKNADLDDELETSPYGKLNIHKY